MCFCVAGVDDFWTNTPRQNAMLVERYKKKSVEFAAHIRNIEYAILSSCVVQSKRGYVQYFDKIKSPKDIRILPGEEPDKVGKPLEGKKAHDYLKQIGVARPRKKDN